METPISVVSCGPMWSILLELLLMRLTEARSLFFKLRDENRIDIAEDHVLSEHAERVYAFDEIIMLVIEFDQDEEGKLILVVSAGERK